MLSTKEMSAGGGKIKPVISTGMNTVKINSVVLSPLPYDKESMNIYLNVETEPVKGDFQGFFVDPNNTNGPRYEGQVGRVRISPYPFKDVTLASGTEIKRDTEILKSMIFLAEALNKRDELDMIEANTIEEFITSCNDIFSGSDYFKACIGGKEWENKDGYINHDLFLPKRSKDGVPIERLDVENSNLITFNSDTHIVKLKKPVSQVNNSFEPTSTSVGDDFDL